MFERIEYDENDGKSLAGRGAERAAAINMERIDNIARKRPSEFAVACYQLFGIKYNHESTKVGKPIVGMAQTLSCCVQLEKTFGYFTKNMLHALMDTYIEV